MLNAVSDPAPVVEAPPTQIFSRVRRDRDKIEIRPYDFKRPERISKDQMRALEMLHETFARNFGASLSGYLRTIVEVRVSHAAQMTYSEFIICAGFWFAMLIVSSFISINDILSTCASPHEWNPRPLGGSRLLHVPVLPT